MTEEKFRQLLELEFDENYHPDELLKFLPLEYHEAAWTSQQRHQQNVIDGTAFVAERAIEDASKVFNERARLLVAESMKLIIIQAEDKHWFLDSNSYFSFYSKAFLQHCKLFLELASNAGRSQYEDSFDEQVGEAVRLVCMSDDDREAEYQQKLAELNQLYRVKHSPENAALDNWQSEPKTPTYNEIS